MKILEIRRHSTRAKPGQHLSQEGVSLARRVGAGMGPFDRVVTSSLARAFETAIAMGFAVDEQDELLSTYGDKVEEEVPWPGAFAEYAAAIPNEGATWKYARKLHKFYVRLVESLEDGQSALVVNHGGVVEISAVACLPDADHVSWGGPVGLCEGVRLHWEREDFVKVEVLRVVR